MSRKPVMPGRNLFHVNATEDACNTLVAYMCLDVPLFSDLKSYSYFFKNVFEQSSETINCVEKKYLSERYLI